MRVCLVTHRLLCGEPETLLDRLARAVEAGVSMVVVREKDLDAAPLCRFTGRVQEVVERSGRRDLPVIVNRRLDVALASGAAGVHLPAGGLDPADVRLLAPAPFRIGVSTHSVEELLEVERQGADYAFFGPVFPTESHPGRPGAGIEKLRRAVAATSLPVWAIGGIRPDNLEALAGLPLAGVAVIRAIWTAADPADAVRRLSG